MKTYAANEKQSAPSLRKAHPYVHHPMRPAQQAQQAEIRTILRSTGVQAKLTIGQSNDKYEQEADRVADQVMAMPDPKLQRQSENKEEEETLQTKPLADQITPLVQRQEEPPEEEEELQAKSKPGETPAVAPSLESRINSMKAGGQPLDPATRVFFEPCFGHDFSQVRVHTSSQATDNAKALNAQAFTVGHNITFGTGQYVPETSSGKRLLAHELAHVVQQSHSLCRLHAKREMIPELENCRDKMQYNLPKAHRRAIELTSHAIKFYEEVFSIVDSGLSLESIHKKLGDRRSNFLSIFLENLY